MLLQLLKPSGDKGVESDSYWVTPASTRNDLLVLKRGWLGFFHQNLHQLLNGRGGSKSGSQTINELLWVILLEAGGSSTAIGLVYLGVNKPVNDPWNDEILDSIHSDITLLHREGHRVVLLGDFNGHIHVKDGGPKGVTVPTNSNGLRVLSIVRNIISRFLTPSPYVRVVGPECEAIRNLL